MTCSRYTETELTQYLDEPQAEVSAHLSTCADCTATVEFLRGLRAAVRSAETADAPSPLRQRILQSLSHMEPFVGRERQMAQLRAAHQAVWRGESRAVLLHGPSGMGKTALLDHFLGEAGMRSLVLRGRCHQQEAVPYQALQQVVEALAHHLPEQGLPRDAALLARSFPALRHMPSAPTVADAREERRLAALALRDLLRLVAEERAVVLCVDDLQWGDADSTALLGQLAKEVPRVLLIGGSRGQRFAWAEDIAVEALSPDESQRLLQAVAAVSEESARAIMEEACGNPFFLRELARQAGSLEHRIDSLPAQARRLLQVVAVAGRPLQQNVAQGAVAVAEAAEALSILSDQGLTRVVADRVETGHDRIREAVVSRLTPDESRALHLSLGQALEARSGDNSESLAVHFQGAGDAERAARYAVAAGERAAAALAFDSAATFFRMAIENGAPVHQMLAEALANAGRGREAANAYQEAMRTADGARRIELQLRRADQLLMAGYLDEGMEAMRDVLSRVGVSCPRSTMGVLGSLGMVRARLAVRGMSFVERREDEVDQEDLLYMDTCSSVAQGFSFTDPVFEYYFHSRFLLRALQAGEPARLAVALAEEACRVSADDADGAARAKDLIVQAQHLARQPAVTARVACLTGSAHFLNGHWRDAYETSTQAEAMLTEHCKGADWQLTHGRQVMLWSLIMMGRYDELAKRVPPLLEDARQRGDLRSEICLRTFSVPFLELVHGRPAQGLAQAAEAIARWSQRGWHVMQMGEWLARCQARLYLGEAAAAWHEVEEGWKKAQRSLMLRSRTLREACLYVRGRCAVALASATGDASLLRRAEDDAAQVRATRLPHAEAVAMVLEAAVASVRGQSVEGALQRAEAGFRACDMRFHAALCAMRRGGATVEGVADAASFARMFVPLHGDGWTR